MTAAENAPDPVAQWIATLWPDTPDGEWLSIFAQSDANQRVTLWAQNAVQAAKAIHPYQTTHNIWLGCATRTQNLGNKRGGATDCRHIPGLWLDIDIESPHHARNNLPPDETAAQQVLDQFPIPPSIVIHSGNGLQPWWLLTEPLDITQHPEILDDWAHTWTSRFETAGYHLDNVFDVARVLRVAGTLNHKNRPPKPVTIHTTNPGQRYNPPDIEQWLTTAPAPPPPKPAVDYIGPTRPGDAFNNRHNGAEILENQGWTLERTDRNGDRHYKHPTASSPTSATVYADDGHTTIWTDSYPNLEPRRPYDPFGLYTALHHDGDWPAATKQLSANGYGERPITQNDIDQLLADPPPPETATDDRLPAPLDWEKLYAGETSEDGFLIEDFWPRGRQLHIFAGHKTGKSLVMLWCAYQLAAGRDPFNGTPQQPARITYLDYEMTEADILERLEEMGATPDQLHNLNYYLWPPVAPLDTAAGGDALLEIARRDQADAVILDTLSRVVEGEENSNDTYQNFYRHTGMKLKAENIALARLAHEGKQKGDSRGGSAQGDDVDIIWRLQKIEGGLQFKKTAGRVSWVADELDLAVGEDELSYTSGAEVWPDGVKTKAAELDKIEAPIDVSKRDARKLLKAAGLTVGSDLLLKTLKYRRQQAANKEEQAVREMANQIGDSDPEPEKEEEPQQWDESVDKAVEGLI